MALAPACPAADLSPAQTESLLLAVPLEARSFLWRGLMRAVEHALSLWESTPAASGREPHPLALRHIGLPTFTPADLRQQTRAETLPPQGWEVLGGAPAFPGSRAGGQALAGRRQDF